MSEHSYFKSRPSILSAERVADLQEDAAVYETGRLTFMTIGGACFAALAAAVAIEVFKAKLPHAMSVVATNLLQMHVLIDGVLIGAAGLALAASFRNDARDVLAKNEQMQRDLAVYQRDMFRRAKEESGRFLSILPCRLNNSPFAKKHQPRFIPRS